MGSRTKYAVDFYLKNLQLDKFDKHCEWLHNNELPERDTYCPDCKTQILHNHTLNIWICYDCFITFTEEEIIELSPHSNDCELCGKRIMWWADACGNCRNKQYKFGDFMVEKLRFIHNKIYNLHESICNYKWSYYEYKFKERQLKQIKKIIPYFKELEETIKKVDFYFDKIKPKNEGTKFIWWKRRCQNNIKYGIMILKKEKGIKNGYKRK